MSRFISALAKRADAWVFDSRYLSLHGLGLFRIVMAVGFLLLTTPGHREFMQFHIVGEFPDTQFTPPFGPMVLLPGLPSEPVLRVLEALVMVGLVSLAFGLYTRASALGTAALLLFLAGVKYSAGKIDHAGVITVVLLCAMACTNWGASWSLDSVRRAHRGESPPQASFQWVGTFLALVIGLGYLAAGLPKLLGGWISPSSQAVKNLVDIYSFRVGDSGLLVGPMVRLDSDVAWEAFDYLGAFWEVGLIFAVFSLRTFRVGLATAAIFHLGNALLLGILYYPLLWVYAVFLDWDAIAAWQPVTRLRERGAAIAPVLARRSVSVPLILGVAGLLIVLGSPITALADAVLPDETPLEFMLHVFGAAVGTAYLVYVCGTLIARWRRSSSERTTPAMASRTR